MGTSNISLMMTKVFPASAEFLFDAWTKPEMMKRWFHAAEKWTTPTAEADLKVGGAWRIEMKTVDGRIYPGFGEYREIDRPHKLVLTFHPKADATYETVITLRFKKLTENSTELTLVEEGFRTEEDKKGNNHGWDECLNCLSLYAAHP